MIPSCIKLDAEQLEKFEAWINSKEIRDRRHGVEDTDCCMTSCFTFHVIASGIGDLVRVTGLGRVLDLTSPNL